jgi:hypothetical protein
VLLVQAEEGIADSIGKIQSLKQGTTTLQTEPSHLVLITFWFNGTPTPDDWLVSPGDQPVEPLSGH